MGSNQELHPAGTYFLGAEYAVQSMRDSSTRVYGDGQSG